MYGEWLEQKIMSMLPPEHTADQERVLVLNPDKTFRRYERGELKHTGNYTLITIGPFNGHNEKFSAIKFEDEAEPLAWKLEQDELSLRAHPEYSDGTTIVYKKNK